MRNALLSFRCAQDLDIEDFLHLKAIEFVDRGLCSVYLLLNEELFNDGVLQIEAYFTLSHKSLIASLQSISKSQIRKYGGFASAQVLPFVLIGQLGKYITYDKKGNVFRSDVTGKQILD